MGAIADKVATMRGCSLQQIVDEIRRMEDGELFALAPLPPNREEEFEAEFWPRYPHKTGKPVALKAFIKARRKSSLGDILAGLARYIASKPADRPWLNPSTFLNQERWNDAPATTSKASKTSELRNDLRQRIGERSQDTRPVRRLAQCHPDGR